VTEIRPIGPSAAAASTGPGEPAPPIFAPPIFAPATIFLGGILLLATLAALYVARAIVLPLTFAVLLNLLLKPVMRVMAMARLPATLASVATILFLVGMLAAIVVPLSAPAAAWAAQLPHAMDHLADRLSLLRKPIVLLDRIASHAEQATHGTGAAAPAVAVQRFDLIGPLIAALRAMIDGLVTTAIFLFFILISGDVLLRRFVEVLPTFRNKRQAVDITQQIECDISAYLLTITGMNALVGVAVAAAMYFCGLSDPILWGVVAFALNYVPVFGPLTGAGLLLLGGFVQFESNWQALLPAAIFFGIHILEGEILTPLLLARRFTLNPVAMILALVFWYWMWGVPGAVLAVPMLAAAKIACDRIAMLNPLGHILEA
jgi:predicted PurR-regulated permease PerM